MRIEQKYTVRANKTRSRIWIEGARLLAAGFTRGIMFDRKVSDKQITLTISPLGQFKVSGKGDRPLIDLCGQFSTGDDVVIVYGPNKITITRA